MYDILELVSTNSAAAWTSVIILSTVLINYLLQPPNVIKDSSKPEKDKVKGGKDRPPAYPNGWIPVSESRDVTADKVTRSRIFINEIILLRDESGKAIAMDAYCPHLGANIGHGGSVVSNAQGDACVRCPFHGWLFRASDGQCVQVPYAQDKKPPPGVKLKQYECKEWNGIILVWYHAEDEPPSWEPVNCAEIESGEWQYGGRTEDIINCHFQEIPENGADAAHLMTIHETSVVFGSKFDGWADLALSKFFLGRHEWAASWAPSAAPNQHLADVTLSQKLVLFGLPMLTVDFDISQIGPLLVTLRFRSSFGGFVGVYVQAITPMDVNKQKIVHHVYLNQSLFGKLWSKFMLYGQSGMLERDILMWNNKKFLKNPVLVKEEKPLARFRQWFLQFYSENSPRAFESPLDW
ncbi:Cholesterol 7-desaturase [Halotydeus destructor]|nr:Cholesterol 7-desaturase [Halotydeus destructor]